MGVDLDAYCKRIGYDGPREPNLETLRVVNLLHPQAIAFENINPLMGWPVLLDAASLEQKLVEDGRGGYCFEHGLLLAEVLKSLGFKATGLSARTIWGLPPGTRTARGHMLLQVELDDEIYLVDVGFGIAALTAPIRLAIDIEQQTPHETYRLIKPDDDLFEMQVKIDQEWMGLYLFDLQKQLAVDFEMPNWYASTHPSSRFQTNLMAARADAGCRHTLLDNAYTLRPQDSSGRKRTIKSVEEMRDVLGDVFRIALPDSQDLDTVLGRIVGR